MMPTPIPTPSLIRTPILSLFAFVAGSSGDLVHFAVGFIILICVLAILILGIKMLARILGATIPPELLMILGILIFIIGLLFVLNYSGYYRF